MSTAPDQASQPKYRARRTKKQKSIRTANPQMNCVQTDGSRTTEIKTNSPKEDNGQGIAKDSQAVKPREAPLTPAQVSK
ncbi:hypothetical protein K458DRAFT_429997 [Lentithecium fluviatile CBS 122367]|uniref:Uncharacterized protein n=1 Tax=Lentithecium fluviatile CBS 122367 TaxID=1168545 RepID=A0A6G1J6F0_9PLEO|nr:hypothetical protein K458DRAFT_429997 [Lentithecium fluviatile CBS 122367]